MYSTVACIRCECSACVKIVLVFCIDIMDTHLNERKLACNVAYERLAEQQSERMFLCEHCSKQFKRKDSLETHLETHLRMHAKDKPFSCNLCRKSFSNKRYYKDHVVCHTSGKTYSVRCAADSLYRIILFAITRIVFTLTNT